jgi:hypothetical protein
VAEKLENMITKLQTDVKDKHSHTISEVMLSAVEN